MDVREDWEEEELRSPDCDGAYWMIDRGRRAYLEKCFEDAKKKSGQTKSN